MNLPRRAFAATSPLVLIASLGALGAYLGGASILRASLRVALGGALALAVTAGIGHLLGLTIT